MKYLELADDTDTYPIFCDLSSRVVIPPAILIIRFLQGRGESASGKESPSLLDPVYISSDIAHVRR
jgi:hypothetical protein